MNKWYAKKLKPNAELGYIAVYVEADVFEQQAEIDELRNLVYRMHYESSKVSVHEIMGVLEDYAD